MHSQLHSQAVPSADSDRLILVASFNRSPVAPQGHGSRWEILVNQNGTDGPKKKSLGGFPNSKKNRSHVVPCLILAACPVGIHGYLRFQHQLQWHTTCWRRIQRGACLALSLRTSQVHHVQFAHLSPSAPISSPE